MLGRRRDAARKKIDTACLLRDEIYWKKEGKACGGCGDGQRGQGWTRRAWAGMRGGLDGEEGRMEL